jgi:hypothetical protein
MGFYVVNGLGDSLDSPSEAQMHSFVAAVDAADEEHGAAWLSTDDESTLEWNGDGRFVFSQPGRAPRHLAGVDRARAVELWLAMARGDVAKIEGEPWADGNGHVYSPEREAEIRRWGGHRH